MTSKKAQSGITLVALIVTIVVLLILAGITIYTLFSDDGVIQKAQNAKTESRAATVEDEKDLWKIDQEVNKYLPNATGETLEQLLNRLVSEGALTEEEKAEVEETGQVTIGSRTIVFGTISNEVTWTAEEDENGKLTGTITSSNGQTVQIGDYVDYDCSSGAGATASYKSEASANGYSDQTFVASDYTGGWRVLGVDENNCLLLISSGYVPNEGGSVYYDLNSQAGYVNGEDELKNIGNIYGQGENATGGRSVTVEDINKITGYDPNNIDGNGTKYGQGNVYEYGNKVTYTKNASDGYIYYEYGTNGSQMSYETGFNYYNNGWKSLDSGDSVTLTSNYYYYRGSDYISSSCKAYEMLFEDTGELPSSLDMDDSDIVRVSLISNEIGYRVEQVDSEYDFDIGHIDAACWLGSRCVRTTNGQVNYGTRNVCGGYIGDEGGGCVRPAISLASCVQVEDSGTQIGGCTLWNIQ